MASNATPKKILLSGSPIQYEALAGAAGIKPGHMVKLNSAGAAVVHATAAGAAAKMFVRENELIGKSIADAYANGDQLTYYVCKPGDRVYAWLETANNAVIGSLLESDGAGGLQLVSAGFPVAQAVEAVNNATGAQARIKVEIL